MRNPCPSLKSTPLAQDDPAIWLNIFALRRDDYVVQIQDGSWRRAYQPLTDEVVRRHLEGSITVGSYLLQGSMCRVGIVDGDYQGSILQLQRLGFRLQQVGVSPVLELSRPGRAHLWLITNSPVEACVMRRLLIGAVRDLGLPLKPDSEPGLEVIPKQDSTEAFGSTIRGPLGIHRKTGQRYPMADLVCLNPLEPLTVTGQLILWDAWPNALPEDIERAAWEFPDHYNVLKRTSRRNYTGVDHVDIVHWAERLTNLHPNGRTHVGLCPFHDESEPSFHVYRDTGSFYCFGCGRWGDAADLKAKVTGAPLKEVLQEARANA